MKLVFSTFDIVCAVGELREDIIGSRVNNVYDINNKTFLLRLTRNDEKVVVLIESGARIHLTEYGWAKSMMPSGFSMKLRKHIRNRKISDIKQLGMDRIVDLEFGFGENAYHLIAELYDRGNICLTDNSYTILHLLRPRTDANLDVRYATHEKYPIELARSVPDCMRDNLLESIQSRVHCLLEEADGPWNLPNSNNPKCLPARILSSEFAYGQPLLEHCCRMASGGVLLSSPTNTGSSDSAVDSVNSADALKSEYSRLFSLTLSGILSLARDPKVHRADSLAHGYIFGKKGQPEDEELLTQDDFHPFLFDQYRNKAHITFSTFNQAVDAYFSRLASQKTSERLVQNEKKANKKFENIKKDHEQRLVALKAEQDLDLRKAQLIESNRQVVDSIILMINHALSNQLDWGQLEAMINQAKECGDHLATRIRAFNLQCNQLTVRLSDLFGVLDEKNSDGIVENADEETIDVIIDLDMNALNNARKYYDKRRAAAKKEEKTLSASHKALKSATFKARQTQQDVRTIAQIAKVRKSMWFEKFYWFISSENYLVVAGRDSQQNELLVKRYLGPDDIYVHADLHGASSVIIKARPRTHEEAATSASVAIGPTTCPEPSSPAPRIPLPPPKTLTEAGIMAVTLSSAWNARVVTNAWWVRPDQVSKTAPSGEYLTTGAFMIRGRKTCLPPCHFTYGFGILFKLDDDSVGNHVGERCTTKTENELSDALCDFNFVSCTKETDSSVVDVTEASPLATTFPDTQLTLDLIKHDKPKFSRMPVALPTLGSDVKSVVRSAQPTKPQKLSDGLQRKSGDTNSVSTVAQQTAASRAVLKRGQRSKLRKIRQKYNDQDEEERHLRMQLLQGEGAMPSKHHSRLSPHLITDDTDKQADATDQVSQNGQSSEDESVVSTVQPCDPSDLTEVSVATDVVEQLDVAEVEDPVADEENDTTKRPVVHDWLRLLDSFTGQPLENDVLLYALPVCAPYSSLRNYKFKVKLTPGTAKRGKASKTALRYFLMDKTASTREKELLRALKSEDVSRNFPGSVKISLPQGRSIRPK